MAKLGRHQWNETYPSVENIIADISKSGAYVACLDSTIAAYVFVTGEKEPAYDALDGKWLSVQPYLVIHRLAVDISHRGKGIAGFIMDSAESMCLEKGLHSIKVDTNHDNSEMLNLLKSRGYAVCGTVEYPQGRRLAFEKLL